MRNKYLWVAMIAIVSFLLGYWLSVMNSAQMAGQHPINKTTESSDGSEEKSEEPSANNKKASSTQEREILYWVAPMDPNFRRDKPGKSPMGMDLVPVYADQAGEGESGHKTVSIEPTMQHNLAIKTASVKRGVLKAEIRSLGYVTENQDEQVHLHPRVEGWIERLHIRSVGTEVERGQVLFSFYSPTLINAQQELITALTTGDRRLINASVDRLEALGMKSDAIEQVRKERRPVQQQEITAPFSGVITQINVGEGAYITPSTEVLTLSDFSSLWLIVDLLGSEAELLQKDMPAKVRFEDYPGRVWRGRVEYIYPSLDQATRTLRARIELSNRKGLLRPNMFAQVVLSEPKQDSRQQPHLLVPRQAIIRGVQDRVVLALEDGRFRTQPVTVKKIHGETAAIASGLTDGDRVVVNGQFLIDSESYQPAALENLQAPESNMDHSNMDHSNMDHSNMDHSNMDHSNMDHSNMDHSNMDHSNMDHSNMDHSNMHHSNMDHSDSARSQSDSVSDRGNANESNQNNYRKQPHHEGH